MIRHGSTGTGEILIVQQTEAYAEAGFLSALVGDVF